MLGNRDAIATIAVKDLEAAKRFYEGVLGLKRAESGEPSVLAYKSGSTPVMVYQSQFAGTNKATALTWVVRDELEGTVQALKAKGVKFEKYVLPNTTQNG